MTVVLDISVALAWFFDDERSEAVDGLLDRVVEDGAVVPVLWKLEIANGLRTAMRRKRIEVGFRDAAIAQLLRLPVQTDFETVNQAWGAVLNLADQFDLTPYDAAYLELARRQSLPLATLDTRLRGAAGEIGVRLLGRSGDSL